MGGDGSAAVAARVSARETDTAAAGSPWWRARFDEAADGVAWRWALGRARRRHAADAPVAMLSGLRDARSLLLVTRPGLRGAVVALPAVRWLRRVLPDLRMDLLCTPKVATFFARESPVDHCLPFLPLPPLRRWREFRDQAQRVGAMRYGLVMSFHPEGERELSLLARDSGAPIRIACGEGAPPSFFNLQLRPGTEDRYLPEHYLALLAPLGGGTSEPPTVAWVLPERETEVADRLLRVKGLKRERPLLAVDPDLGAEEEGAPPRRVSDGWIAELLHAAGARGILLGEGRQVEFGELGGAVREPRDLGLSGLREAAGVLACCDGFVGGNSAFFHLAVQLGLPAVGLFPPGTADCWRPSGRGGVLLLDASRPGAELTAEASAHLSRRWGPAPAGAGA